MRNAWCHLFHLAYYTVGVGFTSAATRSRLGFVGTGADACLAAIVQPILIAQLILRVEAIPIMQTILVLLASLVGSRQRRRGDCHDQCDGDEQKQQLSHRFFPFCSKGQCYPGERQTVPQSVFSYGDAELAR